MAQYRFSELNLEIETASKSLKKNLERYKTHFDCKENLRLNITYDILLSLMEENDGASAEILENGYIATLYNCALFDFNGFPINATAVENDGRCVLFSSPFENVDFFEKLPKNMVFDYDYPAVRLIDTTFMVYDTPFGSHGDLSRETRLPLTSIVFVDSDRFDTLKHLEPIDFIPFFVRAVAISIHQERTKHTLFMLEKLMHSIQFYGVKNVDDVNFILERV